MSGSHVAIENGNALHMKRTVGFSVIKLLAITDIQAVDIFPWIENQGIDFQAALYDTVFSDRYPGPCDISGNAGHDLSVSVPNWHTDDKLLGLDQEAEGEFQAGFFAVLQ